MSEIWIPEHPTFGRVDVVPAGEQLHKTDVAVVRTTMADGCYYDIIWGAGTQHREVVGSVVLSNKEAYVISRDDVFRLNYRLTAVDGHTPVALQGMYRDYPEFCALTW
jgi:hypothetical protein